MISLRICYLTPEVLNFIFNKEEKKKKIQQEIEFYVQAKPFLNC